MVKGKLIQLPARQRVQGFDIQTVGVVVGRQHDDGILIMAGFFKLLQQHADGFIQLDIAGKVGTGGLRQVKFGDRLLIAHGHGVAEEIILQMPADRQIIGHKVLIRQHGIQRGIHHIHIGFRPHDLNVQSVAHALIVVAKVRVGFIAGIIGIGVVVVGAGGVTHGPKLIAEGEGQPVGGGFGHTPGTGNGDHPQKVHIFAVQRGNAPNGIIEIGELKALAPQLVEIWSQVGIDGVFPQAFAGKEDEILPRKVAGILIFGAGGHFGKVAVHLRQCLVLGRFGQRRKVDLHHLLFSFRLRLRFGFRLQFLHRYRRHGAKDGIACLDAEGGKQPKAADRKIADKIGGIQAADAHSTAGIQQGPAGGDDLQRQRCDKRPQQLFPLFMAPSNALFALPEEQRNGHQHKQQRPPAL